MESILPDPMEAREKSNRRSGSIQKYDPERGQRGGAWQRERVAGNENTNNRNCIQGHWGGDLGYHGKECGLCPAEIEEW